jgi:hypothetical protein
MIMDSAKANKAKTKEKEKMGDKKPKKKNVKNVKKKPVQVTKIETPKVNEQPAKGKAPAVPKKKK